MVSCTVFYKVFSGFWKPCFSKMNKLLKVTLTNCLTYLFVFFKWNSSDFLDVEFSSKWPDKLFTQKSLSNHIVDPQVLMKGVGSAGSFQEVIPNLFEVKNSQNLLQLLGHQFCHRFLPNKLNGLPACFFWLQFHLHFWGWSKSWSKMEECKIAAYLKRVSIFSKVEWSRFFEVKKH